MSEDRIHALTCWNGPVSLEPFVGGITNLNYRVRDGDACYMVRLCEDKHHLGIDRRNERACQEAAVRAGVAPEVVHYDGGILVSRFVDAPPLSAEDVRDRTLLTRLGTVLRRLHHARDELTGEMLYFCPFQTIRTYAATAMRMNARLPEGIEAHLQDAQRLSRELTSFHPTLCHNDLLPVNIIDNGQTLWLVDWEYAGIGNPLFDIASISSNSQLSDDLEAVLLEAYTGTVDEQLRREVRILKAVSLLREALWSVIQSVASKIDFDYEQYAAANIAAYQQARDQLDLNNA
ncbi:MAG: phosphotransferase [Planctomycetaceae bacterium]